MLKKCIILIFFIFTIQISDAASFNSIEDAMPQYTATFHLDNNPSIAARYLVLRFYQAFGDGSSTGWQAPVAPPTAILDGQEILLEKVFAYGHYYNNGGIGLGFDQYAQYYGADIPIRLYGESILKIIGTFQQVAYMSATVYTDFYNSETAQVEYFDREMDVLNQAKNPYIFSNPSVFAYHPSTQQYSTLFKKENGFKSAKLMHWNHPLVNEETGKIGVYRLDQFDSQISVADDIAPDGCSRAYLFAQKNPNQEMIILRMKVPKTFIDSDHPDTLFGDYQTRYFSVGSHRTSSEIADVFLSYWTVNARMLKEYEDSEGYAYVFFAPNEYTINIAIQQNTPLTQPPVITWGQYKGYLLGNPDFAIIMRYRDSNATWRGNPENATCYATPSELKPVNSTELGEYLPEIYGDTMEHFNQGKIGLIENNKPWPSPN